MKEASSGTALHVERDVGPDATATHIPFPFRVDQESECLEIAFSYEPKILMDDGRARELIQTGIREYAESLENADPEQWRVHAPVRNLLTLSLDGPLGFRGCAHRFDRVKQIVIGRTSATPGFIPGPIEAGPWKATVSVHLVATERCTIHLEVRVAGTERQ